MQVWRTTHIAYKALKRNLMRSLLTTLGIVIGIAAVIAMIEIGQGSSQAIQRTIASMGANNLTVVPGTAASGGVSWGLGTTLTLTPQDAEAIVREVPAISGAAPVVRVRSQVVFGNRNWVPQQIFGTTPDYLVVREWTNLLEGEPFSERDVRNASKVCVLGTTIVRELFGGESPVGKEIRIQNVAFKVIGVLSSKGANMMGSDQDDIILAPWTTIKYRVSGTSANAASTPAANNINKDAIAGTLYPTGQTSLYPVSPNAQDLDKPSPTRFTNIDQIVVSARSAKSVPIAIKQITSLLRDRHRIQPGEPEDFNIRDMAEMTKIVSSTARLMTTLLLCVALITLIVGGVGIMNIMLVSVTERTREIGLRLAVGARGRDILEQFIVEAVVLCLVGGVVGIVFGRMCSYMVTLILGWPIAASIPAIIAAFLVSASVGIIFGFYPAWKASQLDPIEALRYE